MSVPHYESDRVIFTWLRLSSHASAIEKGHWGRMYSIEHIECDCNLTAHIRARQPKVKFQSLHTFFDHSNLSELSSVWLVG